MRWLLVLFASCHLAESPEPPKCDAGSHANLGHCEQDAFSGPLITISSCAVSPSSIMVAPNGDFRFQNDDDVEHTVSGADGQVWVTASPHQPSSVIGITKVGTWPYQVSGCTGVGTGTVVVQ